MTVGSLNIDVTASTASLQAAMVQAGNVSEREMQRLQRAVGYATARLNDIEKAQRAANVAIGDQAKAAQVADRVAAAAKSAGVSVGQMNSALRNTPAQMSDIATQLAGGQSPFLVLTQQGLQMKDMYGGLGPMFAGLGTMISPVTVAVGGLAAAGGLLAYVMTQASKEQESFNKAIALTGGFAGVTKAGLDDMADRVAKSSTATVGAAREIGQELVRTGRVGPDALEGMTLSIAKLQAITGESASTLTKDFARMSDGVAKWAAEHNKQYHFLTVAEYRQIAAAEKAGEVNRAMDLTMTAINGRLQESKLWWDSLTKSMEGYWESLKKAAGPSTNEDQISGLRAQLNALRNRDGSDTYSSYRQQVVTVAQQREMILGQIKALQDKAQAEKAAAVTTADVAARNERGIADQIKADEAAKKSSDRAISSFVARKKAMDEEIQRLQTQNENWKQYGRAISDTAVAKLEADIKRGELGGFTKSEIGQLRSRAEREDQLRREGALQQQAAEELKKVQAASDAYAASQAQHTMSIDREIAQMQAEVAMVGKTAQEREIATQALKIHAQAQEMAAKHAGIAADAAAWEAEQVAKVTAVIEKRNALSRDPQTGVARALAKYKEDADNVARYAENMISGGLSRMEDAVVSFVHTGKLSFGSLWEFMADEFIRQQARMVLHQAMGGGSYGGLLGTVLAALGSTGNNASTATANAMPGDSLDNLVTVTDGFGTIPGHANGLDYVPRDNYLARLHRGERVLTAAQNSNYRKDAPTVVQHISIGAGVNRAEVMAAIAQSMEAVKGQILSSKQHRGAFS